MIQRYNLIQILLIPLHLSVSCIAGYLIHLLCKVGVDSVYTHAGFLLPLFLNGKEAVVVSVSFGVVLIISAVAASNMWQRSDTFFPGVLSAVPVFGTSPLSRSSYGEIQVRWIAVELRILGNLLLLCPMQLLFAIQRIRNLVPDTKINQQRVQKAYQIAEEQPRWHSTSLYHKDREALNYLIRFGKVNHSPTKSVVKASS